MVKKKFSVLVFSIILTVVALSTLRAMVITVITPTENPYVTSDDTVNLSYGIDASDGLNSITHSWNGTNYTLYDSSLVLFMNFDNRSELGENDTFVRDLSMYGNNGSVVGGENITWGAGYGKYNGAFNFSGNKNDINGVITQINYSENYTINIWFNPVFLSSNYMTLISDNKDGSNKHFDLQINQTLLLTNIFGSGCSSNSFSKVTSFSNNTWQNLILIFDKSNNKRTIYLNGILLESNRDISGQPYTCGDSSEYHIGSTRGTSLFFNGLLDDVFVINRSLTFSEAKYLYRTQITKYNESYFEYNTTVNNSAIFINNFLCTTNSTEDEFCSTTNIIREVDNIKVNFSDSIKEINYDMYGFSTSESSGWSSYGTISLDNDCTRESVALYDKTREAFINSGSTQLRLPLYLSTTSYYEGILSDTLAETREEIEWAYGNNVTITFVTIGIPDYLANKTDGLCTSPWSSCNPTNLTKFNNYFGLLINNITNNGEYIDNIKIEFINEAAQNNFLNNLSVDNSSKGYYYNLWYNSTYIYLKEIFPTLELIPTHINSVDGDILFTSFISNFSNQFDGINLATYPYSISTLNTSGIKYQGDWMLNLCNSSNATCNKIYVSEWNTIPTTFPTYFNNINHSNFFADNYLYMLNNKITNYSSFIFKFDATYLNNSCSISNNWSVYSPITNVFGSGYNVTSAFAHLCPAGATVYVTSGDDSEIKQVSCKKGNMYSLIVINTGTEAKNVTLNMSMTNGTVVFPYSNLVNYEDDTTTYKVSSDGISQLGVMDSYEILYLYSGVEGGATLRGVFKLNEGSGNTIYDSLQNLSNGVKSGATWVTDGVLVALTNIVDYTYTYAGVFTVNNSDYYFEYLSKIFTFQGYTVAGNIVVALIQGTASFGDFWEIIVLALVIVIVLAFLIRALGTSNKR